MMRLALAMFVLGWAIGDSAVAADLSGKIEGYSFRRDRAQMAPLLEARSHAAPTAVAMVDRFQASGPSNGLSTRLSSGETRTATRIAEVSIGGDRVAQKAREEAAFLARPAAINDPAIFRENPDPLKPITQPLERIASSLSGVAPLYYYYPR